MFGISVRASTRLTVRRCNPIGVRTFLEGPKKTVFWTMEKETTLESTNPATGIVMKTIPMDNIETLTKKYHRARNYTTRWRDVPYEERANIIRRFGENLLAEKDALAETLTSETGKPITQAKSEIEATVTRIKFFLDHTEQIAKDQVMRVVEDGRMVEKVTYDPLGVILNISAWNYPYFVGSNVWIPALLTGSTIMYKPSEIAIQTGQHVERLMHNAGVHPDAFILITGKAGVASIATTMPVDAMFFTGSYGVGRNIAKQAGNQMMKFQVELGGKCPVYVTEDVDIAAAAESIADGAFYNTGQSCCAVDRIYVHRKVYDQFEAAFVRAVAALKFGLNPMDPKVFFGPLARESQLGFLEHLTHHAVRRGAEVLMGGKRVQGTRGFFFEPTVIGHCNHTMEIMHRESFGPIVGLQKVNNDDDAVSLMNDTQYGLTAAVYGNDEERCTAMLRDLNVGTCYWNACDRVSPYLPWTGVKHSGFGSTLGLDGIRNFLRPRAWHLRSPAEPTQEQAAKQRSLAANVRSATSVKPAEDFSKTSKTQERLEEERSANHPQPGPIQVPKP